MRIFVYGTLLPGLRLHEALQGAKRIDHGFIEDAAMFDLGQYPGLVSGQGNVHGEIFEVGEQTLKLLDRIEGYFPDHPDHSLFLRLPVTVWGMSGDVFDAEAYFLALPPSHAAKPILCGDYRRYLIERDPLSPVWIIAYGSNLSRRRLEQRVGKAHMVKPFLLDGYDLNFNKDGAYANLIASNGKNAPAAAWQLTQEQVRILDRFEGEPEHYMRLGITVVLDEQPILAQIYLANPDQLVMDSCPEGDYLAHILTGYHELGFDGRLLLERLTGEAVSDHKPLDL